MTVKAVKSFSGERFNMHAGEVREVNDTETVQELLRIGYLEDVGGLADGDNSPVGTGGASPSPTVYIPEKTEGLEETPVGAGLALPEQTAPEKTEDMPEKTEGLNENKRGKSKRN